MEKPWIGIPTRYHEGSESFGQIRHYLDAILWAGGLPLLIPTVSDPALVRAYAERAHGLLLPGSPTDIDPAVYGAERHPKLGKSYPERDTTDFALLDYADLVQMPVVGICFGAQSLNVHRGGTLVQDIPSVVSQPLKHDSNGAPPAEPTRHSIKLDESSVLARVAAVREIDVNSYHHQSIERAGRDLKIVATAPDGVVEAVEDSTGRFALGLQWHPERGWWTDSFSQGLFRAFLDQARQYQSRRHSV